MKKFWILYIFLLFIIVCKQSVRYEPYTESKFLMDTYVRISIYDNNRGTSKVKTVLDSAFLLMQELEKKLSAYYKKGEIYNINHLADKKPVEISETVSDCLQKCQEVSRLTSGKFDISIGVIKQHWCFNPDSTVIPDSMLVKRLLNKVDYKKIFLENRKVYFKEPDMKIDLGGAAKGYIIDKAMEFLNKAGIDSVIIEGGGDFRITGHHPERHEWRIGVRHPRKQGMKIAAIVQTKPSGFATSGDYERFFLKEGVRYHHLLDPETGFPAPENISVTIIAETAFMADALVTAVFIMGPDAGIDFIDDHESIEGLIIFKNNENEISYKISQGFKGKINL